jgi:hypothetical protein
MSDARMCIVILWSGKGLKVRKMRIREDVSETILAMSRMASKICSIIPGGIRRSTIPDLAERIAHSAECPVVQIVVTGKAWNRDMWYQVYRKILESGIYSTWESLPEGRIPSIRGVENRSIRIIICSGDEIELICKNWRRASNCHLFVANLVAKRRIFDLVTEWISARIRSKLDF